MRSRRPSIPPLDAALERVNALAVRGHRFSGGLERFAELPGSGRKLQRIASVGTASQLEDLMAEVRYALVFQAVGFEVEVEPSGDRGADFAVSWASSRYLLEVSRFVPNHPGPRPLGPGAGLVGEAELHSYGDVPRETQRVVAKVLEKRHQLQGADSIFAVWSDDEDLEEVEPMLAARDLVAPHAPGLDALRYIVFGSRYVRVGDHRQFWVIPVNTPPSGSIPRWVDRLARAQAVW